MNWLKQQDLDSGISFITTRYLLDPIPHSLGVGVGYKDAFLIRQGAFSELYAQGVESCAIGLEEDNQPAM